ncbi:MAG: GNAT family N-acetyltransferase [Streptosporangiaceae bacterium]
MSLAVSTATVEDAAHIGRLLHDFNREFDAPTPAPEVLAARLRRLLADGDTTVLLGGDGPDGLVVLRYRPAIWTEALECWLAELYVVPLHRGHGLGRALLEAATDEAREHGADRMELATGLDDGAARSLYERLGFTKGVGDDVTYFYERELS